MPIEVRTSADLPPNVCGVCRCSEEGEHILVSGVMTYESQYLFICPKCVQEMADKLGLVAPATETKPVEVVRAPSDQEILDVIAARFTLAPAEKVERCACGEEFTGPTAKAKLGSHQRSCKAAKETKE